MKTITMRILREDTVDVSTEIGHQVQVCKFR
jgi:hypothetical protein